jgi:predicted DNA-binding transcriptional regulator AlpA
MLNKVEAAEYLGCTTRTLERHIKDKKIGVIYHQSKFGEIAMFDPQELADFKSGKTATRMTRIVPATPYEQAEFIDESTPDNRGQIVPAPPQKELASRSRLESLPLGMDGLIAPIDSWFGRVVQAIENVGNRRTITELRSKPLVTLDEAQIITGLSREILIDAIKKGQLPTRIMGKAYRIKQADIDRYISEIP